MIKRVQYISVFLKDNEGGLKPFNEIKLNYYLLESDFDNSEEFKKQKTFGIEIEKILGNEIVETQLITDYSCTREVVIETLQLLARNSVTPVALKYVLEDLCA